ncbi:MAG TPA: hypothetical protein VNU68_04480 [Verrucomicrobiae bacterium]|nr:hypothetical protein [Verrucomicrobiae bacterium]
MSKLQGLASPNQARIRLLKYESGWAARHPEVPEYCRQAAVAPAVNFTTHFPSPALPAPDNLGGSVFWAASVLSCFDHVDHSGDGC